MTSPSTLIHRGGKQLLRLDNLWTATFQVLIGISSWLASKISHHDDDNICKIMKFLWRFHKISSTEIAHNVEKRQDFQNAHCSCPEPSVAEKDISRVWAMLGFFRTIAYSCNSDKVSIIEKTFVKICKYVKLKIVWVTESKSNCMLKWSSTVLLERRACMSHCNRIRSGCQSLSANKTFELTSSCLHQLLNAALFLTGGWQFLFD